ncbi:hypothetical protein J3R83DRAFT_11524 [Lanmaoa asiatica]|nr:hypothetical protein J3R83DRAFT_11524 [Lanmaoa asiatica]
MHLKTLLTSAVSQEIIVMFPLPNAMVSAGSDVTVQVQYQLYANAVDWVSVVVGLFSCPTTGCPASGPTDTAGLGTVLAQAAYAPRSGLRGNTYQNLTVTIPDGTSSGLALIGAAGFYASGASSA